MAMARQVTRIKATESELWGSWGSDTKSGQLSTQNLREEATTPNMLPPANRSPMAGFERVRQAELRARQYLPRMAHHNFALEQGGVELIFRHDCMNLGCGDDGCNLCMNNPKRRCATNFCKGYVDEDLRAKCKAAIRVEVVDKATGRKILQDVMIFDVMMEFFLIDGNKHDRSVEGGRFNLGEDEVNSMAILTTHPDPMQQEEPQQLLISADPTVECSSNWKVCVPLKKPELQLPALRVLAGSEVTMPGKAPFRLVARAFASDGGRINIPTVISEPFVIESTRTLSDAKVDHPTLDIQPDTRPRAFFPPSLPSQPSKGLLFAAKEGQVNISQPSALLLQYPDIGIWRSRLSYLSGGERSVLQYEAERSWLGNGHVGWSVLDEYPPKFRTFGVTTSYGHRPTRPLERTVSLPDETTHIEQFAGPGVITSGSPAQLRLRPT